MPADPNNLPGKDERLDSWKEIASYLGKGIRTVQRWEQTDGLPVHRLGQDRTGWVFAYKSELDAWWTAQSRRLEVQEEAVAPEPVPPASPPPESQPQPAVAPSRWVMPLVATLAILAVIGTVAWSRGPRERSYQPVPLTSDHGWEWEPSFSPDGGTLAFVRAPEGERPRIYLKKTGDAVQTRLTTGTEAERAPAWSPDGRSIAFLRPTGRTGAAVMLIPSGGGPEAEIARIGLGGRLAWSPDGQWLITVDGRPGASRIVAIQVATGASHALTDGFEFQHYGYSLSPDLRRLLFCRSGPGRSTVFELPLGPGLQPTGKPRAIMTLPSIRDLIVTADATEVIYTDGLWEEGIGLWRQRLAPGAEPVLIYQTAARFLTPALSRDGRKLAFGVNRVYREDIWRLTVNTPQPVAERLISSTHSDLNPQYSPDGTQIAFHSTRSGASDIWISDRHGAYARQLTHTSARTTATPRWSPDGKWIAFESNQSGQTEIYLIRSSGGPARQLTHNRATDAIPGWSRDGKWIYFCSDRSGRFEIWKVPVQGGEETQVTREGGFTAVESLDGRYLFYTRSRNAGPLFRLPLPHGTPEQIIPDVRGLFYAVSATGIYYHTGGNIRFWDAQTSQTREIFSPPRPPGLGMAVSPDGREALFTQIEAQGSDLYLIDGLS